MCTVLRLIFIGLSCLSLPLFAATPENISSITILELNKLTASDGAANAHFGFSVAISGTTIIIGAAGDKIGTGAAYIYEYQSDNGTFVQSAKLTALDGAVRDYFAKSVAIYGDTVVIGAPENDVDGSTSGSAYIFEKASSGWADAVAVKLTAPDAAEGDEFGISVAISGDTVVVGAYYDDDIYDNSGSAYVFERTASGWANIMSVKLTASDSAADDYFGTSVAISGDTVIVGMPWDDDSATSSGSAYLFEKPASGWDAVITESAKLTASDGALGDYFGNSVAISGNTLVVGASGNNSGTGSNSGAVYIFEKPVTGWISDTEKAKLTAYDGAADDYFGQSVAIDDDTIIVGAYWDDDSGIASGSAYLFKKTAPGWSATVKNTKLTASDGAAGDEFGFSVAISADIVIVGAHYDADVGISSGSAYPFEIQPEGVNPAVIMYLLD